jgi:hypothetical protein
VRPQARKDEFLVNVNAPQGPYHLSKTPLEDSLTCQVVYGEKDKVDEKRRMMLNKKDFTINYPNRQLTFSTSIIEAGRVEVAYVFPGIFTMREFRQEFFIDVFDNPLPHLERLTAVVNAFILTEHDMILDTFNKDEIEGKSNTINRTLHSIGKYQSEHTLRSIRLLDMTLLDSAEDSPSVWSLKYEVLGMIKAVKEIDDGYGIIQTIVSPGMKKDGVNIDINLG